MNKILQIESRINPLKFRPPMSSPEHDVAQKIILWLNFHVATSEKFKSRHTAGKS